MLYCLCCSCPRIAHCHLYQLALAPTDAVQWMVARWLKQMGEEQTVKLLQHNNRSGPHQRLVPPACIHQSVAPQ